MQRTNVPVMAAIRPPTNRGGQAGACSPAAPVRAQQIRPDPALSPRRARSAPASPQPSTAQRSRNKAGLRARPSSGSTALRDCARSPARARSKVVPGPTDAVDGTCGVARSVSRVTAVPEALTIARPSAMLCESDGVLALIRDDADPGGAGRCPGIAAGDVGPRPGPVRRSRSPPTTSARTSPTSTRPDPSSGTRNRSPTPPRSWGIATALRRSTERAIAPAALRLTFSVWYGMNGPRAALPGSRRSREPRRGAPWPIRRLSVRVPALAPDSPRSAAMLRTGLGHGLRLRSAHVTSSPVRLPLGQQESLAENAAHIASPTDLPGAAPNYCGFTGPARRLHRRRGDPQSRIETIGCDPSRRCEHKNPQLTLPWCAELLT